MSCGICSYSANTLLRRRWSSTRTSVHVDRQLLAGAHVERHARPAPRVDVQPHRGERLDVGVGRDAVLVAVALELAAHEVVGLERLASPLNTFSLRVAQLLDAGADRRLHREQRDGLEQVVLR